MCILIHHPINTVFNQEQLLDFYKKNSDGFGAIVKHGDTVEIIKSVGSFEEIESLYQEQVAGHESIIHFRMKTHGEIDIANCHPYEVIPGLWMAHNGILSTGNHADPRMSDTWHYIQDFLKPVLEQDPSMIFNEGFQRMIAGHIGSSNKFGFMNQDGDTVIINEASGVSHQEVWYSNTYAWTPWKFGYGTAPAIAPYKPAHAGADKYGDWWSNKTPKSSWDERYASSATWRNWNQMDKDITAAQQQTLPLTGKRKKKQKKEAQQPKITTEQFKKLIRHSYNAVQLGGFQGAMDWIDKHPMSAMRFIYEVYGNERSQHFSANAISNMVNHDVGDAADLLCEIWEEMEPDLCELAGIQLQGDQHVQ